MERAWCRLVWGETLNTNCHHQHGVVPGSTVDSRGAPARQDPYLPLQKWPEAGQPRASTPGVRPGGAGPLTLSLHLGPPGCSPSLPALFPPASSLTWFSALCRLPLPLGGSLPGCLSACCLSRSWLLHPLLQGPSLGPSLCFHVCFSLSPLSTPPLCLSLPMSIFVCLSTSLTADPLPLHTPSSSVSQCRIVGVRPCVSRSLPLSQKNACGSDGWSIRGRLTGVRLTRETAAVIGGGRGRAGDLSGERLLPVSCGREGVWPRAGDCHYGLSAAPFSISARVVVLAGWEVGGSEQRLGPGSVTATRPGPSPPRAPLRVPLHFQGRFVSQM